MSATRIDELLANIPKMRAAANKHRAAASAATEKKQPQMQVQLPIWPEPVRAVPNGFLRSALFGAVAKGRRRYMTGEDIAAIEGVTIRYKGERLDQGDLDVWESVLHAVRVQSLGSKCRMTSYSLLRKMGKTDSGKNRATLHNRIERLVANAVTVKQGRYTYIGSLIRAAAKDETTQEWVIEIDENLRPLFNEGQFTCIEWGVRHALDGHQLAQWLHGFYSSHAQPYPMKIETLHRLCGSEAGLLSDFAKKLRKALGAVQQASAAARDGFSYSVRGGLVHVQRTVPAAPSYRSSGPKIPFQRPRDTVPAAP